MIQKPYEAVEHIETHSIDTEGGFQQSIIRPSSKHHTQGFTPPVKDCPFITNDVVGAHNARSLRQ